MGPVREGVLLVRVTRPPVDGEANDAVRRLLADALGVPISGVTQRSGAQSRVKRFELAGLTDLQLAERLAGLGD